MFITRGFARELIVFPFTYVAAFFTFGRLAAKTHYYKNTDMRFIALSLATIAVCIVLNRFARGSGDVLSTVGTSLYAMTCTLFALIVQYSLRRSCEVSEENAVVQKILQEKEKQYEQSLSNVEMINIKCHDLKYAISGLDGRLPKEEIASVTALIDDYEQSLKTGCDALDVVMGETLPKCRALGIELTFMGDASRLSAMAPADIYSLFGNVLDNSVEAVRKLTEPGMKSIGMTIENREGLVFVSIYNYYEGDPGHRGRAAAQHQDDGQGIPRLWSEERAHGRAQVRRRRRGLGGRRHIQSKHKAPPLTERGKSPRDIVPRAFLMLSRAAGAGYTRKKTDYT